MDHPTHDPAAGDLWQCGPFLVDHGGVLHPQPERKPAGFGFHWRGRRVNAQLRPDSRLDLSVVAGCVPYTAEAVALRPGVFAALAVLRDGAGLRVALTPSHAVLLEATEDLGAPVTATRLIEAATRFVLRLQPCLDLLEEAGARLLPMAPAPAGVRLN